MSLENLSLADIKRALKGINRPFYREWVYFAKNKGYLDPIVLGLVHANRIEKASDAIAYLSRILTDDILKNTKKINYGDFQNSSTSRSLAKKLIEEIEKSPKKGTAIDKTTRYGSYGHSMAAQLFSGNLIPNSIFLNADYRKQNGQIDLFPNGYHYELLDAEIHSNKKKTKRKLFKKLIEKIEKDWKELVEIQQKGYSPFQTQKFKNLVKDLRFIYKDHITKVLGEGIEDEYLASLTLMTWVPVLLYYAKIGNFPLFSEVFILENSLDVGVGRLDVLSVVSIDGKEPTKNDLKKIRQLTRRPFHSVGHVIQALVSVFGTHLCLKITDWKFAVGDGVNGMRKQLNIIKKEDVAGQPLRKHKDQVERYLSLSILSHSLASGFSKLEEIEKLWEQDTFSLTGELVYFFPDEMPIIHSLSLSKDEVKSVFKDQIVSNFNLAKKRNRLRTTSNIVLEHILHLIKEGRHEEIQKTHLPQEMFSKGEHEHRKDITMSEIIMKYYQPFFMDEDTKCIEVIGKRNNREILELNLSNVFNGINTGKIIAEQGFNRKTGGKICCPVHHEKTPSFSIALDIGKWRCFGCGISGEFNTAAIPDDIEIHISRGIFLELDKLLIPPRHAEIMLKAQEILTGAFPGSRAETYLALERGLNPEISRSFLGAGYGNNRLIEGLIDAGFTLDELIYYGICGISTSKNAHTHPTVHALKHLGISIDNQTRLTGEGKAGLPYSILEDRLTYPLEIFKIINSIYGRALDPNCPKNLRHRKVRSKETGMRHGGINISLAVESKAPYIMVSEAGINAATFIELARDIKAQTALVGVNNPLLIEYLARSKSDIIFALDYDLPMFDEKKQKWGGETGQKNTVKLRDVLVNEYNFKGKIYDFTSGFVKANPGIAYNDINKYLVDYGARRINVLDYIREVPREYINSMDANY